MADRVPLVIVGDSGIAEVAYEYFTHDSQYEVRAFAVEREYLTREALFGVPVVAFEEIESLFPPGSHEMFVALGFNKMNRVRARLYAAAKARGYRLASYVSSRAFVWRNVAIGDNCFILENNVIQAFASIGNDVTLWSGNHIGHHSKIGDHCFIASHIVISGYVEIGTHCFFGVNATVAHNVKIGNDCLIGASALVLRDTGPGELHAPPATAARTVSTYEKFGIEPDTGDGLR